MRCVMGGETIANALGGRRIGAGWMARCPAFNSGACFQSQHALSADRQLLQTKLQSPLNPRILIGRIYEVDACRQEIAQEW